MVARIGYEILGKANWKLKGKMGNIRVPQSGIYTIKGFLTSNSKKVNELKKAEIVFSFKISR